MDSAARFIQRIQTREGLQSGCVLCKIGFSGLIAFLETDPQALVGCHTVLLFITNVANDVNNFTSIGMSQDNSSRIESRM